MSEKTSLVEEYRNYPAIKKLGQHFLTNQLIAVKMVESAKITGRDTVLEIGPGLGILSSPLTASPAKSVILVEKDRRLSDELKKKFTQNKTKIITQDALTLIPSLQVSPPLKVVANLPYNISSAVLISLLTVCPTLPDTIIVMLQKEVAQRLTSMPGETNRGILTVLIELFGKTKIIDKVSKNQFYPSPQVDSAVIEISDIKAPEIDTKKFFRMLKMSFAGKRKKLKNSIFSSLKIPSDKVLKIQKSIGVDLNLRPEDLTVQQWLKVYEVIKTVV